MASAKPVPPNKVNALKLARQAQGMLAKVIDMIETGEYCPNVIQQVDSTSGFLMSVKRELLAGHLDSCVMKKMQTDKQQAIKELMKIYNLSS